MMSADSPYSLRWLDRIQDVGRDDWNRLALTLATPFLEWEWLHHLEASGSIAPQTGWHPRHLTVWRGPRLVAAAPLYIKTHSLGEFVFDRPWAEVAEHLGTPYYPKLVGMSPVTPAPGYRFLVDHGENEALLLKVMLQAVHRFGRQNALSGVSFLFVDPGWRHTMMRHGFLPWVHPSFTWENEGFDSFDDYLSKFRTNQRRNIRRERKATAELGISITPRTGDEIPLQYIPLMYRLYLLTNQQFGPWGCRYLNQDFFKGIYETYRHRLLFMVAADEGRQGEPIGMSLLVRKGDRLYGRYWGTFRKINALHFNTCYYAPIDWSIRNNIRFFDPGMGGLHKVRRGFTAVPNYSLHRFYDPQLFGIMQNHIDEINRLEGEEIAEVNAALPFSRSRSGT